MTDTLGFHLSEEIGLVCSIRPRSRPLSSASMRRTCSAPEQVRVIPRRAASAGISIHYTPSVSLRSANGRARELDTEQLRRNDKPLRELSAHFPFLPTRNPFEDPFIGPLMLTQWLFRYSCASFRADVSMSTGLWFQSESCLGVGRRRDLAIRTYVASAKRTATSHVAQSPKPFSRCRLATVRPHRALLPFAQRSRSR